MIFLSSLVIEAGLMNVPVLHRHRIGEFRIHKFLSLHTRKTREAIDQTRARAHTRAFGFVCVCVCSSLRSGPYCYSTSHETGADLRVCVCGIFPE